MIQESHETESMPVNHAGPGYRYKPLKFFLLTLLFTWAAFFAAAYCSYRDDLASYVYLLENAGLAAPCIVAMFLVFGSGNARLKKDFRNRLTNLRLISPMYLLPILLIMPVALVLATAVSLLFGQPTGQFALSPGFSLAGGYAMPLLIAVVLAPIFEELGWRGYGVDSLYRKGTGLLRTGLLFGAFWVLWHSPLFLVKGMYWNVVLHTNVVYGVNIVVQVLVMAFLTNWVFYKCNRSIPANILFHCMLNLFASALQTEQFTKCIITVILLVVAVVVVVGSYRDRRLSEQMRPAAS